MSEAVAEARSRADQWRDQKQERAERFDQLAEFYLAAFSTPAGQRVLLDLEAQAFAPVLPADCSEGELRDLNGQKRLYGIIMERIEHARRRRREGGGRRPDGGGPEPGRQ